MAFDQNKYIDDFKRQNYDRLNIIIPKGKGKVLKDYAKTKGMSVSQVIVDALENHCKLDLSKQDGG